RRRDGAARANRRWAPGCRAGGSGVRIGRAVRLVQAGELLRGRRGLIAAAVGSGAVELGARSGLVGHVVPLAGQGCAGPVRPGREGAVKVVVVGRVAVGIGDDDEPGSGRRIEAARVVAGLVAHRVGHGRNLAGRVPGDGGVRARVRTAGLPVRYGDGGDVAGQQLVGVAGVVAVA